MALTGTGIRIGTVTEFGVSVRFPRGLASDGTTLRLFDANKGYTLDLSTGIATPIGTLTNFGVSEAALRSATYHNNQFVFFGQNRRRIFEYDPSDGGAEQITAQLTIQGSSANPDIWGLASLDGTLWALERGTDKLYTVDIANDMLIPVGTATDFGLPGSPNLQSFTAYDGELIAISNGLQKLVRFDQTTGIATLAANGTVPDAASEALAEHAGQLFLAGSGADALFRMYDVQWDTTIPNLEVDEAANGTLDLSTVSDDAASFEFAPTHTARTWLTIAGTVLTVTTAPDVTADTDFEAQVRAIRDSAYEDKTVRVRVRDTTPPPPSNPPTFMEPATHYEVNERASRTIDSTEFFTGHTRLAFQTGSTVRNWLTISGLNVVITDAPDVLEDTNFTVPLTATNNDGSVNGSLTISAQQIDPAPVFGTPNRFDIDEGSSSVFDLSGDLQNTESLAYQSGYSAPSWLTISGLTLVITNAQQVSQDTDFDVLLAAESTKTAATADRTVTIRVRDVAVPPPPPSNPPTFMEPATHYEVNERASRRIDSTEFFTGHTHLAFQTDATVPSWLTISGLNVVITGAPDVLEDTDFTVPLTATNSDGSVNGSIMISVQQIDPAPVFGTPNRFDIDEGSSSVFDLSGDLQNTESLAYQSGYSAPSWLTISGLTLVITNAQQVLQDTDFDVLLAAESTKTAATADRTVTIRVRDVTVPPPPVTPPGAPTSLSLTKTHNSIVATWRAAANNGGEAPSRYDIQINGGGWIDAGLDLTHTFENLSPETQYTIDVVQVNSTGRGTPASKSVRTDAAPIVITTPGAPRSLSLTKTHNSIVARWAAAANNGGEAPSRYDVQINRGQWIDTGLDLRHTFENLLPETEYLIEVVQVNSAGRGTPASRRVRTDAAPTAPAAPQNLTVELTATTAILKWAISGTGSPADTYEVSYAEGDRVGSDWIDTKNLRTRFFIRRLKRATRYTFAVRGRNSEGAGDASRPVTQNTPIASLHNALFFKECVNYFDNGGRVSEYGNPSNIIRAVADNDYNTFTREKDLVINIAVGGNSTRVDAIFVKGIDIEGHSAEPTGGTGVGYNNRVMPLTVKNWEGTEVSTVVAGFQHDLYLLDSHFTATSVRMMFTGTDAKIYEIMLLEFGLEINANSDFTQINPDFVDRSGVVHPDAGSGIAYSPSIGDQRDKWEIDYVVKVVPGKTLLETPEEFLYWRAKNKNHVFAMEPSRFPWRVFPAVFVRKRVPVRYRTDDKLAGEVLNFRVAEQ